jgi:hypothetical protein
MIVRRPFRDITTAPHDGTTIEVQHSSKPEIVRARWSGQAQAWTREHDLHGQPLRRVSDWRGKAITKVGMNVR